MPENNKTRVSRRRTSSTRRGGGSSYNRRGSRMGRSERFFRRYPRWAWWVGGLCVVVFYVWVFYNVFVGPFGFRWRALYGEAKYPDGYEIELIEQVKW